MEFRKLGAEDLGAAHAIVVAATDWLNARGIVQWTRPIPLEDYAQRQVAGHNFGLFDGDRLVAVMTLAPSVPERWRDRDYLQPFLWLSTLAVAADARGQGRRAIEHAEAYGRSEGLAAIYLDCVDRDDALPSIYRAAGYTLLEAKEVWPGWPMCLFEKRL